MDSKRIGHCDRTADSALEADLGRTSGLGRAQFWRTGGFGRTDYLRWYMPRLSRYPDAIHLDASGVKSIDPSRLEVATGDPWQMVGRFEAALAGWLGVSADELCFTPGGTGGTLLALLALVGPDDEILVESPVYEPMLRQAARVASVRRFYRKMENGWNLPLEEIKALLNDRVALVMITEPSNPSGTLARREDIVALAEAAARYGARVLVNEVYRGFSRAVSFHGLADNIVVVSSLSKLLGAYGMRLGWLSTDSSTIPALRAAHLNMGMAAQPSAAWGLGVLAQAETLSEEARRIAEDGVKVVDAWVKRTPGLEWVRPEGPGFGCVKLPGSVDDDIRFAERLHDEYGVLVVPGRFFELPGTIRLSWLQAGDRLEEGLERFSAALCNEGRVIVQAGSCS